MKANHTHGPLKAVESETYRGSTEINVMAGSEVIATCHHLGRDRNAEYEANGRLFAKAPDLFALLERILEVVEAGDNFSNPDFYDTEHQQMRGLLTLIREGK